MNSLDLHNQHTLDNLQALRTQASLERQLPRRSLRSQLARALRSLSERLEPAQPRQAKAA